jgi:hypothetical protein
MKRLWLVIGVVTLTVGPGYRSAEAQSVLTIRRETGEIGATFDGVWTDISSAPAGNLRSFSEWLLLGFAGDIVDPRIATYRFGLAPSLRQKGFSANTGDSNGNGYTLGFFGSLNLLQAAPVSVSLTGGRMSNSDRDFFGTERSGQIGRFGVTATNRNRYFDNVILSYQRSSEETRYAGGAGRDIRQSFETSDLELIARNRKTLVRLERFTRNDRITDVDFAIIRAELDHMLRWGKGSRLRSNLRYFDQTGSRTFERLTWSQAIRLRHTMRISSDYSYRLYKQSGTSRQTGRFGSIGVNYNVTRHWTFGVNGSGASDDFGTGHQSRYTAGVTSGVTFSLPLNMQLSGGGSLGSTWLTAEGVIDSNVEVIGEQHVIDSSRRFRLANRFVQPRTVVITDFGQTITYQEGFDYQVSELGSLFDVLVLPGGRIAVGDTVSVDYTFTRIAGGSTEIVSATYYADLRAGALQVFHRGSNLDPETSGELATAANNRTETSTGIAWRTASPIGEVQVQGRRNSTKFRALRTQTYAAGVSISSRLPHDIAASIGGTLGLARSGVSERQKVTTANASLGWVATRVLQLRGEFNFWENASNGSIFDRFVAWTGGADLNVGLTIFRIRYIHRSYLRDERAESQFTVDARRRF